MKTTLKISNTTVVLAVALALGQSHQIKAAGLTASDGAAEDYFGYSVSQSGKTGFVGAWGNDIGGNVYQGLAYVFRNLDTTTDTVTETVKLTASDGAAYGQFGASVSQSGTTGLVGAQYATVGAGAAYVYRNLDTVTGTVIQHVKLTASDGEYEDHFGSAVSLSGSIGLVGAHLDDVGAHSNRGGAYVYRNLNTATGTVTEDVKLTASDGAARDNFGTSVSQSGSIGLVGAPRKSRQGYSDVGAAYVYRNLDTATGTVTQAVKLVASGWSPNYAFGQSVSLSGTIGLVGTPGDFLGRGAAYIFRNLDTATGTVTENVKLTVFNRQSGDYLGNSVSLSGSIGLVGATANFYASTNSKGSAYIFRNLDTATGTVTENVKLTASDGAADDKFGGSVSLDGDHFIIGASGNYLSPGKAYSGSVSSLTTLDTANTSKTISGISFVSQDDWIIGDTTDANQVTLSAGDTANVTAVGKAVYIGKNAGSDNNKLVVAGNLIANQINVGATGNTGNSLQIGNGGTTGALSPSSVITNHGNVIFKRSDTITQGTHFGSGPITGTGSIIQAGSGTTILNAANTYTGQTWIQAGTLKLADAGTLGASTSNLVITGGSLDLGGTTQNLGSVSNYTYVYDNGYPQSVAGDTNISNGSLVATGSYLLDGVVSANLGGTASLSAGSYQTGGAFVTLSGTNTYTGKTDVLNDSVLELSKPASLYNGNVSMWTSVNISVQEGSFLGLNGASVTQAQTLFDNLRNSNNGQGLQAGSLIGFGIVGTSNLTWNGVIGDSYGNTGGQIDFSIQAAGVVTLAQTGTLTGLFVGNGTGGIKFGADRATGTGVVWANVELDGYDATVKGASGNWGNSKAGSVAVITFDGGSTNSNGNENEFLGSIGELPGFENDAGDIQIIKKGSNVFRLTGNAFVESLEVQNGTFDLAGNVIDAIAVVESGARLTGNGSLASGRLDIEVGATIAPGTSAINPFETPVSVGTLATFGLDLNGTLEADFNGSAAGVGYDQIVASGPVSLSGNFTLNLGYAPSLGTLFFIINNTLSLAPYSILEPGYDSSIVYDGSIIGTFAGLQQGAEFDADGYRWSISYNADFDSNTFGNGNDVAVKSLGVTPVPEASTYAMYGVIGAVICFIRRRRLL